MKNVIGTFTFQGVTPNVELRAFGPLSLEFAQDGTEIGWDAPAGGMTAPDSTTIQPSEVDMEFTGTAAIYIRVPGIGGKQTFANYPLRRTLLDMMGEVRRVLRRLEPFVSR